MKRVLNVALAVVLPFVIQILQLALAPRSRRQRHRARLVSSVAIVSVVGFASTSGPRKTRFLHPTG
jgi:hypothetical protein